MTSGAGNLWIRAALDNATSTICPGKVIPARRAIWRLRQCWLAVGKLVISFWMSEGRGLRHIGTFILTLSQRSRVWPEL